MSFWDRLIHHLAIVTPVFGALDDYGQPTQGTPVTQLVRGLIQPRKASEVAAFSQAGEPFSDYVIFLAYQPLSQAAFIRDEPDLGRRFDVIGVRSFEFGSAPHLEVDARLVGSDTGPSLGS